MIGLLSAVRFGITLGMSGLPPLKVLNELLIAGQPAHMQLRDGRELSSNERNRFRADLVRERMTEAMRESTGAEASDRAPNKGEES
jgi:protein arginine kinase